MKHAFMHHLNLGWSWLAVMWSTRRLIWFYCL